MLPRTGRRLCCGVPVGADSAMWLETLNAQASVLHEHKLTASVSLTAKSVSTALHVRGISRDRTHTHAEAASLPTAGGASTALPVV
jgi:hypothetical protein